MLACSVLACKTDSAQASSLGASLQFMVSLNWLASGQSAHPPVDFVIGALQPRSSSYPWGFFPVNFFNHTACQQVLAFFSIGAASSGFVTFACDLLWK